MRINRDDRWSRLLSWPSQRDHDKHMNLPPLVAWRGSPIGCDPHGRRSFAAEAYRAWHEGKNR
jgi:hypothetical protein